MTALDSSRETTVGLTPDQLRALADAIESRDAIECEGWTAAWCAIHGDCTCCPEPLQTAIGLVDQPYDLGDDESCPLHGRTSAHAPLVAEGPQAEVTQYTVLPSGASLTDPGVAAYAMTVDYCDGGWLIRNGGMVFNRRSGEFDHLSSATNRDDVVGLFHYPMYEALTAAKSVVDSFTVAGHTYAQRASH